LIGVVLTGLCAAVLVLLPQPVQVEAASLSAEAAAGYRTADKLWIAVSLTNPGDKPLEGILQVELLDPAGKSLGTLGKQVHQAVRQNSYQFEFPAADLKTDGMKVRYQFGTQRVEVELPRILLAKAHETSLATAQEFYTGSTAALRCDVHAVKSITDTVPLPGATVEVTLHTKDGKSYPLYSGKTEGDGITRAQLKVPRLPGGDYKLQVATKSALGEEKLERDIRIKSAPRVLLVTDKPLYQPGQLIHIRALCLRPYDLTPVDNSELTFEVEDPKGNKVFKRAHKTSDYGVAAVDFQLADEVNMGDYQVRALIADQQAQKTVTVKRYVLPKFKVDVSADKKYYLPKEFMQIDLQSDYFFGKPVAHSKIKVTASTFDVQFRDFQTWEGKTDANGHAKLEVKLPDYFVGQPLQKGDALVKLEVKITDTADHTETVNKTYPVAEQPIRISLIPEGGRLVPNMENRLFAAAIYPDGSPAANCEVKFWKGKEAKDKPHTVLQTNEVGLAEIRLTPKAEEFRQGEWGPRNIEMIGGAAPQAFGPKSLFDVTVEAKDSKGNKALAVAQINGEPLGENVMLRLDRAIYRTGDALNVEVLTSAGLPTTYLDIVKGGQALLTRWLDVKNGKATHRLDLPPELFGTLEIHAYQQLASGEIIRDSRVIYVHSREDLKIEAKADKDVYQPGQEGKIRFQVTDAGGKPTSAALGVIVVDEAVYALQEMQPGLEKVYFTLQEELLKPQAQLAGVQPFPGPVPLPGPMPMPGPVIQPGPAIEPAPMVRPRPGRPGRRPMPAPEAPAVAAVPGPAPFKPDQTIDGLVRQPELSAEKQQIAEVLLTSVKPKPPALWRVDPVFERKQGIESQLQQIGWALFNHASNGNDVLEYDSQAKRWTFKEGILQAIQKTGQVNEAALKDPFGKPLVLDELARIEKNFTPDRLAQAITLNRMQNLMWSVVNVSNQNRAKWFRNNRWSFPENVLALAMKRQGQRGDIFLKDGWGRPIRLLQRDKKQPNPFGQNQFDYHELVSAGPDGRFDTADDVKLSNREQMALAGGQWFFDENKAQKGMDRGLMRGGGMRIFAMDAMAPMAAPMAEGRAAGPMPATMAPPDAKAGPGGGAGQAGAAAQPVRLREYFPETMLWQPLLITDERGRAELPLSFADSITTWRLSASASSRGGALGGLTAPLRVFQDFFVDLDLPVSLTQNDEIAFPVAVYNYLKTPQVVKLDLQREAWFDLADEGGFTRSLDLKPGDVTSVKFRIKARKLGQQPLTVKAIGSHLSDAIKRSIEVVPDGQKIEQVVSDKLTGQVKQTLEIPDKTIPDSAKLIVKLYPGVFSQVLEGTEGMLRMPGG
jgi:5-hydroxyisourate hydrolase-like protein (transthyretin family)